MKVFILAFALMLAAVAAMAIGVIVANRRIRGSCGGLGAIEGLESACEVCAKPCRRRRAAMRRARNRET